MKSLFTSKVFLVIFAVTAGLLASEHGWGETPATPPASTNTSGDSGISSCNPITSGDSNIKTCLANANGIDGDGNIAGYQGNDDLKALADACLNKASIGTDACFGGCSPIIQKASAYINIAASAIEKAPSVADKCQQQQQTMKTVNDLLATYNAACGAAQGYCSYTCNSSIGSLKGESDVAKEVLSKLSACGTGTEVANACCKGTPYPHTAPSVFIDAINTSDDCITKTKLVNRRIAAIAYAQKQIATCPAACDGFKENLGAAALTLVQNRRIAAAAEQCNKDLAASTVDCNANPTDSRCPVNCAKPEFASNVICICQMSPRTAGCPGAPTSASDYSTSSTTGFSGATGGAYAPAPANLGPSAQKPAGTNATTGNPSVGGGSGGGAGGVGGGSPNLLGGPGSPSQKSSGYYYASGGGSGGGGGGGHSSHGGGYADPQSLGNGTSLKAMRNPANGHTPPPDIAESSGSSNFDRISQTYQQKASSFIGGGQ